MLSVGFPAPCLSGSSDGDDAEFAWGLVVVMAVVPVVVILLVVCCIIVFVHKAYVFVWMPSWGAFFGTPSLGHLLWDAFCGTPSPLGNVGDGGFNQLH